jgi:hypothetical protein
VAGERFPQKLALASGLNQAQNNQIVISEFALANPSGGQGAQYTIYFSHFYR